MSRKGRCSISDRSHPAQDPDAVAEECHVTVGRLAPIAANNGSCDCPAFYSSFERGIRVSTIYLLRHGETVWNTLGRFQGQKDSSLTPHGIEQADLVASVLRHELADAAQSFVMHVSPLGRTRETARRVRRVLSVSSIEDARLMEVTAGSWDGVTTFEIDCEFPGYLDGSDAFDWYFKSPDGESFGDACNRAKAWIADIRRPTIAISHGLFRRIIRGVYAGLSKREMLELPVPHDGFHRLHDGAFSFVDGSCVPAST